ncbi:hypothetical protein M3Y97_00327600 [Aphelenchoides bicaudatus]|nr:hypothetical protein M3Y97_00327600 [Aphelenchoides bicaudatus]
MLRNQAQSRSTVAAASRMPKLSNKQLFDLLRIHEENLAALRDCQTKPPKHEQDLYDNMCKAMQQRFNIKLSPIGVRSQIWRLKERVERKVNAAACKSGSTDEEVLLKTAGFTPVEAHLYKLLTDKVLPLVIKDQREVQAHSSRTRTSHPDDSANQSSVAETPPTTTNRSKATKTSPTKSETATPRKKAAAKAEPAAQTTVPAPTTTTQQASSDEPPAKKRRSHKKKTVLAPAGQIDHEEVVAIHSEPETTNVDAYMDTIERVAQMGRTAPGWYDEHLLQVRLPTLHHIEEDPSKKKKPVKKRKTAVEKEAERQQQNGLVNGRPPVDRDSFLLNLKLDPAALRINNDDLLNLPTNGPVDELQREKQLLCRTQRLLAAQRIALQTRQAEMLQSQTKFFDAWSGLASTFSSFFNFLPTIPQPVIQAPVVVEPKRRPKPKKEKVQPPAQPQVQQTTTTV